MIAQRGPMVPVAPFRERFLSLDPGICTHTSGRQPKDAGTMVAEKLGWRTPAGHLDSPRVRRALGLKPAPQGHGLPLKMQDYITYPMALRLCEAMDMDPVDVGL